MPLRLLVVPLDVDVSVTEAVRRLAHRERVTAWSGEWEHGGLVTCDPATPPAGAFPRLPEIAPDPRFPGAVGGGWFGYVPFTGAPSWAWYGDVLRFDGTRWWYEALAEPGSAGRAAELAADLARPADLAPARFEVTGLPDPTTHVVAVERCVQAIRRGEIFQANIACGIDGMLRGGPHAAWAQLVEALAPARAGLVADPERAAVGASPELFLSRHGTLVTTSPIKGTRPRTGGPGDAAEKARLAASTKDAAENVMIVDLMRNDLSRVCAVGSVRVAALLAVEPHPGVWHLVSTVTGELAPGRDDADLLAATLPPGSVTGAPKIRAVELIEELEDRERGLFTGALGYVGPLAGLELAVAIRSLEVTADGHARLGVGGGVTVDSTPVEEFAECLTKAAPLLRVLGAEPPRPAPPAALSRCEDGLFETLLVVDGHPRALPEHMARLRASFVECYGQPPSDLAAAFAAAVAKEVADRPGRWRVRVDVRPDAPDPVATAAPAPPVVPVAEQPGLVLVPSRLGPAGGERHKFADRRWIDAIEARLEAGAEALLVDDAGLLLETTRCNVFVVRGDSVLTPPLDGRILPGIARRAVLDALGEAARPAPVGLADLADADGVFVVNALRGVRWVREVAGVARWVAPDRVTRAVADRVGGGA